ncbi:hypothetical protein COV13_01470 [Candidatus Woesearchaeota archaeon CG10_big_fil_rev_8_21_14_0_10_32_9]|nr:MAG: hypothetical protein COV13_01470 [Candidatus Woesearchaeota archaeon CG10_big_fil_rev_8_21_14_0_10_32_9]
MQVFTLNKSGNVLEESNWPKNTSKLTWVRLVDPKDSELEEFAKVSEISLEELKDIVEDSERSRIDYEGKYIEIIYQVPYLEKDEYTTSSVAIFLYKKLVITIERTELKYLSNAAKLLSQNKFKSLMKKTPGQFIHYVLDKTNDEFLVAVEKIGAITKRTPKKLESGDEKQLYALYESNITLTYFNNALLANQDVSKSLRKTQLKMFTPQDKEYFSDLYYDALQVMDTLKVQRDVLTSMFTFQSILSGSRLNKTMKLLTGLTLLIAVPTLIASIYGMNVSLPLAENAHGFLIVLVGMFLLSGIILWVLHKNEWL